MIKHLFTFFVAWTLAVGVASAQAVVSPAVQSEFSRAELLVHAPEGIAPGQPVWLGLQITHAPDWHTYWVNPGDSGLPTEFEWQVPAGVIPGDIMWPTPRKFPLGDLANYGYDGTVLLPVPLRIGADFEGAELRAEVLASWLICRKECIPEEASFELPIPAQMSTAGHRTAFEAAWQAMPAEIPAGNSQLTTSAAMLEVQLEGLPAEWRGRSLEFFPETPGLIEPGAAWQQSWEGALWKACIPLSRFRQDSPEAVPLVVALANPPGQGPGTPGVRLTAPVPEGWPAVASIGSAGASDALLAALAENAARAAQGSPAGPALTLWAALLGALIGGMILNLMPCVFPILAMKAMALARLSGAARAVVRGHAASYTAGVVLSFLALGALLVVLRAVGGAAGWGFQFTQPVFVAAMAWLMLAVGLNLSGVFAVRGPVGAGSGLAAREGHSGSFFTGVLAVLVATPCTAPFMAAAIGAGLAMGPVEAMVVFGSLGAGMALPYALLGVAPGLARHLPRPGPWMERLKQGLAFPMYAAAAWLVWVLAEQSGAPAVLAVLLGGVLIGFGAWAWGITQGASGGVGGRVLRVTGVVALAGALALLPLVHTAAPAAARAAEAGGEAWSAERVAALRAEGRPVFVNLTAAWCISCKVNERVALATEGVQRAFAERGIVYLVGDWTRGDAAITALLRAHGREGVPLYLFYPAGGGPPILLPQILTEGIVLQALDGT